MGTVTGIAHFTFHEGMADRFVELSARCREIVVTEDHGTTRYDVFLAPDRSGAVVVEEYVDMDAALAHQEHIGDELNREIIATAAEVHGELLGDVPPEYVDRLSGGTVAAYLTHFTTP